MGRAKRKGAVMHAQHAHIQLILPMQKYHARPLLSLVRSVVYNDSVSGQWRSWSDCEDAQSDLDLRGPIMHEDTFRMVWLKL